MVIWGKVEVVSVAVKFRHYFLSQKFWPPMEQSRAALSLVASYFCFIEKGIKSVFIKSSLGEGLPWCFWRWW